MQTSQLSLTLEELLIIEEFVSEMNQSDDFDEQSETYQQQIKSILVKLDRAVDEH